MMNEIKNRGPIACGIVADARLLKYTGGIFTDPKEYTHDDIDHDISVVGWGVENGVKYWLVRNSWGTAWGENGFFRVTRGSNTIMIESDCAWATPVDTWTTKLMHRTTDAEQNDPSNNKKNGPYP